ncbi:MAG TPA: YCF48-related protein, partial [Vicinamibacteria bacterium]|nr:YCF48-related protein [Vicinamibacteria bacterium]
YGRLMDVDFLDTARGWAVGRHEFFGGGVGRIVRSTDGGRTWQVQYSVEGAYMDGLHVIDAQNVIAMGQIPLGPRFLLRTSDGGQTWTNVAPSQAVAMDADFVDGNTGWVVGGRIYKSTNGGQTWTEQFTPDDLLYAVSFGDALRGWAVGWGPTLLRTTDGGLTWTPQSAGAPGNALFAVEALGPDVAWIAGTDGFVARTTDGGQTWQPESAPGNGGLPFEALRFLDAERGWVGGIGIWQRDVVPCAGSVPSCTSPVDDPAGGEGPPPTARPRLSMRSSTR